MTLNDKIQAAYTALSELMKLAESPYEARRINQVRETILELERKVYREAS